MVTCQYLQGDLKVLSMVNLVCPINVLIHKYLLEPVTFACFIKPYTTSVDSPLFIFEALLPRLP